MDPLKLKDVAATLNAFMVKEGFLSEHSVKTSDRLMSCITQVCTLKNRCNFTRNLMAAGLSLALV